MVQGIVWPQEVDIHQFELLVLGLLHFHDHAIFLLPRIFVLFDILIPGEVHQNPNTLIFFTKQENRDHYIFFPSKMFVTALFLDLTIEIDIFLQILVVRFVLHQNHTRDLQLHQEELSKLHNQNPLEI